jgi:hypothetical protein
MRSLNIRLPLLVVSVCMGCGISVWAMDLRYGETVYLVPTMTTVRVPTSYVTTSSVVTGSYLVPTAFAVPTYYPTAFLADEVVLTPTTYVETTYRQGLLGRLLGRGRVVERSVVASYPTYLPTSFALPAYYPTTYTVAREYIPTVFDSRVMYESAYVTSPASPCDEVVSWRVPVTEVPLSKSTGSAASRGTKQVESQASDESTIPSTVDPPGAYAPITKSRAADEAAKTKSAIANTKGSEADSPPAPPLADEEKKTADEKKSSTPATGGVAAPQEKGAPKGDAAKTKEAAPAKIPGDAKPAPLPPKMPSGDQKDDIELQPAPGGTGDNSRHEVKKPVLPTMASRSDRFRNVLFGKVEASAGGQPEEEVRIIVSNRGNRAIRKEGMSDAYGRFAIKLYDGDWTVNVAMPSGRIYAVSQITVSGGKIYDEREGIEIPSLIITR